jgi:hypothetical protein
MPTNTNGNTMPVSSAGKTAAEYGYVSAYTENAGVHGAEAECPGYSCSCLEPGFRVSVTITATGAHERCELCGDPCPVGACSAGQDDRNVCLPVRQGKLSGASNCDTYACSCATPDWTASVDKRQCLRCNNPCDAPGLDPCRVGGQGARNRCIPTSVSGPPYIIHGMNTPTITTLQLHCHYTMTTL